VSSASLLAEVREETRENWSAALHMIREAVETLGPAGILPSRTPCWSYTGRSRYMKPRPSWRPFGRWFAVANGIENEIAMDDPEKAQSPITAANCVPVSEKLALLWSKGAPCSGPGFWCCPR
jgi:hypothetical protein